MTTTMPITASKINAGSVSASTFPSTFPSTSPFARKEIFKTALNFIKSDKGLSFPFSHFLFKKAVLRKKLVEIKSLLKRIEETPRFEGKEEVLLATSIYEVKIKEK